MWNSERRQRCCVHRWSMRLLSRCEVRTGLVMESSSALVTPGIHSSPCLDVSSVDLLAAITAMRVHEGILEIRSHSEHVVRVKVKQTAEGNADFWAEFALELGLKTTRCLHFVARHAASQALAEAATRRQRVLQNCSINDVRFCLQ